MPSLEMRTHEQADMRQPVAVAITTPPIQGDRVRIRTLANRPGSVIAVVGGVGGGGGEVAVIVMPDRRPGEGPSTVRRCAVGEVVIEGTEGEIRQ